MATRHRNSMTQKWSNLHQMTTADLENTNPNLRLIFVKTLRVRTYQYVANLSVDTAGPLVQLFNYMKLGASSMIFC